MSQNVDEEYQRCKQVIDAQPDERVREILLDGLNRWYNYQYRYAYQTLSGCVPRR